MEQHNQHNNQKSLLIQITFFSTKESIKGLGCIARNWAFLDILGSFSDSFSFSFSSLLPEINLGNQREEVLKVFM